MGFKGISGVHAVNSGSATFNFNSLTETGESHEGEMFTIYWQALMSNVSYVDLKMAVSYSLTPVGP